MDASMASDEHDVQKDPSAAQPNREQRVDGAHPMQRSGSSQPHAEPLAVAIPAFQEQSATDREAIDVSFSQLLEAGAPPDVLARQAAELGDHLQQRLAETDRRQSRLNSQEAELESRLRNARLWLEERETELDDREQALDHHDQQLAGQANQPPGDFDHSQSPERAEELSHREQQNVRRETELE
ncbi:unnamed protein product, partial [marine sediment metagenome]